MGFFNAVSSINKINSLLRDLENQVTITQGMIETRAPKYNLENCLNVHKRIHQDLIDVFAGSGGARNAMYKVFGENMRMDDILTYSRNLALNLAAILYNY
ncbi:MAG: hypothetical protein HDS36_06535 [Bacteroides sp.]|nr:hypothetical protein [Bacteroides sp.]MBD5273998.1 hypothetical protein [Bacteroides sp.]MBD5274483.1 hypothetical protein [Bacteroides sp.]